MLGASPSKQAALGRLRLDDLLIVFGNDLANHFVQDASAAAGNRILFHLRPLAVLERPVTWPDPPAAADLLDPDELPAIEEHDLHRFSPGMGRLPHSGAENKPETPPDARSRLAFVWRMCQGNVRYRPWLGLRDDDESGGLCPLGITWTAFSKERAAA
jgi:hypothetical protein